MMPTKVLKEIKLNIVKGSKNMIKDKSYYLNKSACNIIRIYKSIPILI